MRINEQSLAAVKGIGVTKVAGIVKKVNHDVRILAAMNPIPLAESVSGLSEESAKAAIAWAAKYLQADEPLDNDPKPGDIVVVAPKFDRGIVFRRDIPASK